MKRRRHVSRRNFLRGAGGALVGLPMLEMLSAGRASARGTGGAPCRVIAFYHPQGMIMDAWRPTGLGHGFALSEILQPLSAINPATGNPLQDDVVVVSGLDNRAVQLNANAGGHNSASRSLFTCQPLTGNLAADGSVLPSELQTSNDDYTEHAAGASIEQVLAQRIGGDTMYRSVDLSVGNRGLAHYNQAFYAGIDDPIEPEDSPQAAFDRLFSGLEVDDPTPISRLRAARGSVLDAVSDSYAQLSGRLGAADRQRLEAHADKIRELELQLGGGVPLPACETPTVGSSGIYDPQSGSDAGSDIVAPQMIDLAVMALACDLTRVATIQFSVYHDNQFSWLGQNIPGSWDGWHAMIHEARDTAEGRPAMIAAMRWYTEQFAYLMQRLASIPEGDGTMLDNTVVLWLSEFGDGDGHNSRNLPAIIGGNVGGRIASGQHLDHTGRSIGDLNTTIMHAFGQDDATFGYEGEVWDGPTVTGPLSGILA